MKRWIKKYPGRQRLLVQRWALKKFGMTMKDYKTTCESCGAKPTGRFKRLSLDHCHKTKKFRGFLCMNCNIALGHLKDNPKLIKKLLKYLLARRKTNGSQES
jgi:hypothetical protein